MARMSVTINSEQARETFRRAVALVASGRSLPEEWLAWARQVGQSRSRTYIAMLGTALLARATDPRVDPLSLKASGPAAAGFESYSARSVATNALAPEAKEHGVDIGTRGREPLNNQPFFRYDHIFPEMVVKENARPSLLTLIQALERLRQLPEEELLPALAAFIAVNRQSARRPPPRIPVNVAHWTVDEFANAVSTFVTDWPEDGKRGQAMVAAALDLTYPLVKLGHINDPSRRLPGDVHAFPDEEGVLPLLASEVKQKAATRSDVLIWADGLRTAGLTRGHYVLLSPSQPDIDAPGVTYDILCNHNILVTVFGSAREFMLAAISWACIDVDGFLGEFPSRMALRLQEAGVSPESLSQWASLFGVEPG